MNPWSAAFLVIGFSLAMSGVAMYSVPLALIVGGAVLFTAGGLSARLMR
jgi:hypothetical protein